MNLSVLQGAGNFFTNFSRHVVNLSKWSQAINVTGVCFFFFPWLFHYVAATAGMEHQVQEVVVVVAALIVTEEAVVIVAEAVAAVAV